MIVPQLKVYKCWDQCKNDKFIVGYRAKNEKRFKLSKELLNIRGKIGFGWLVMAISLCIAPYLTLADSLSSVEKEIIRDDFDVFSDYWSFRTDGTGTYLIEDGVLKLTVP